MKEYTQIKIREREAIYRLRCRGAGVRTISRELERSPSTISRELRRNSDKIGYLFPEDAEKRTRARKAIHKNKVERILGLKEYVIQKLQIGWSPEAIAGRWNNEHEETITTETIYKFIYSKEEKKLGLPMYLARKKKRRGMRHISQAASHSSPAKISIHQRPANIEKRNEVGHFESDLIFHKGSMSLNVLTMVDRKSRMIFAIKQDSKHSDITTQNILNTVGSIAETVTCDNGTEFSGYETLNKHGIPTFFCDPGSPWQKGSIEHANGMLRRFLPFSLLASSITQEAVEKAVSIINHIPRKSLNFLTPYEVMQQHLVGVKQ